MSTNYKIFLDHIDSGVIYIFNMRFLPLFDVETAYEGNGKKMGNELEQKSDRYGHVRNKRGPSSFWMHDPEKVFNALALDPGDYFLDMGCGPGDYSIEASGRVGDSGMVYAIDRDKIMIKELEATACEKGISNLNTIQADIIKSLPITDKCIDLCFIATVLHIPAVLKNMPVLLSEVCRVLKPGKRLAVIECKKEEMPFGPPRDMRLSSTDIENLIKRYDFKKSSVLDLGYNYMVQFIFNPGNKKIEGNDNGKHS